MMNIEQQKPPESDRFVDWLYGLVDDVRKQCGLSERESARVVRLIMHEVQENYGGQEVYVHSQTRAATILKNWEEGGSIESIAVEVGVAVPYVRQVIRRANKNPSNYSM